MGVFAASNPFGYHWELRLVTQGQTMIDAKSKGPPDLTVLLYVPGSDFERIRRTLESLRAQTVIERLEILLLAPEAQRLVAEDSQAAALPALRIVSVGNVQSRAEAMVAGVRQASAPLVAICGNHSYPAVDWAERLIDAHRGPWAAVAPSERNANPASTISWAHFLIGHGRWILPVDAGVIDLVPLTNGAFKRDVLLACDGNLRALLERDGGLDETLREKGLKCYLEPAATVFHFNISRLSSYVRFRFNVGRALAASRVERELWSRTRRLAYIVGWPLIPFVQLRAAQPWLRRCGSTYQLVPRILPAFMIGMVAHALGEAVGYGCGIGAARRTILSFESDVDAHMTSRDRAIRAAGTWADGSPR